ncbi:MAG TPA: acyl-ACP--UDP-N-acetylglucosamine O-acyltransferase [Myxococcota bacterium]|nr:acyl-ACP--UDP-N-acetylglucosamine O-acyltransferase [Myxococcota bacterium]HND30473.1 acyl-ACP--UDP-N-acetylglucosamine O-acyltransferase [Myxococcota bacterium]
MSGIHATAVVDPRAEIGTDVEIGPFSVIGADVVLRDRVVVGPHVVINGPTVIGEETKIYAGAALGGDPQDLKYRGEPTRLELGARNIIREHVTLSRGTRGGGGVTRIGDDNLFMAGSHVAHDCQVGNHCIFANYAAIAGHVHVQDRAILSGFVGVHQFTRVGRCAMVSGGAMVVQDVPPFCIAQGDRARLFGLNIVGLRRAGMKLAGIQALKAAYRELYHQGLPMRIALEQVREVYSDVSEVVELVEFIAGSQRGTCRSAGTDAASE